MTFSSVIALGIVIATALTLNKQGITQSQTLAPAAKALEPVTGGLRGATLGLTETHSTTVFKPPTNVTF